MDSFIRTVIAGIVLPLLMVQTGVLAETGDTLDEVMAAIGEGRYEDAFGLVVPLAEQGNPQAQNILGGLYLEGWGVDRDVSAALRWLGESAAQGDPRAFFNLGLMFLNGNGVEQDCDKAMAYFLEPAEAGNPIAQVNIAGLYAEGTVCTPQDYDEGVRWLRVAAAQGDPLAQHSLGAAHANGQGVPQDFAEAMAWYEKAAEQGYAESQAMLGWMHEFGEGVEPDVETAIEWYRLAAAQGHQLAGHRLQALESGEPASDADPGLLANYLMAPAEAVAIDHSRMELMRMMLDLAVTIHMGDTVIDDDNREQVRAELEARDAAIVAAMKRRGSTDIRGKYSAKASRPCSKIQSMWAEGIAEGMLKDATIDQEDHDFKMLQPFDFDGEEDFETPGVVLEDAVVFTDVMNTDFLFVGHVSDNSIAIRPDADFILGGWPDWVKAPRRKDLERCEVTLTRIPGGQQQ